MVKRGRSRSRSVASRGRSRSAKRGRRTRVYKGKRALPSKSFGQPKTKLVSFPYQDTYYVGGGAAGVSGYRQLRANSIYDPDYTGAGHQPLTHDQWSLFYNHYVVTNAKITVHYSFPSDFTIPVYIGIVLSDDPTTTATASTATFTTLAENKHIRYRLISPQVDRTYTLTYHANVLKFMGRSKFSTDVKASFGDNPTEQCYFTAFVMPANIAQALPFNCVMSTMISYTAELQEPKELSQS